MAAKYRNGLSKYINVCASRAQHFVGVVCLSTFKAFSLKVGQSSTFVQNTRESNVSNKNMERFTLVSSTDNLCFLCLKPAEQICPKCSIPYCSEECNAVHYNPDSDYCYPFRVLQKPGVGRYLEGNI